MNKKPTIYLDLDGTLANLYAVDNWLECLEALDPYPYQAAEPIDRKSTRLNSSHS